MPVAKQRAPESQPAEASEKIRRQVAMSDWRHLCCQSLRHCVTDDPAVLYWSRVSILIRRARTAGDAELSKLWRFSDLAAAPLPDEQEAEAKQEAAKRCAVRDHLRAISEDHGARLDNDTLIEWAMNRDDIVDRLIAKGILPRRPM